VSTDSVAAAAREASDPKAQQRALALLVAPLVAAAFLVAFGALHYGFYTRGLLMDTPIYERYGDAMVHGGRVPYSDFSVEYPPAALPVFAAPSLVASRGDFGRYREIFEAIMLLCGAGASALAGVILVVQRADRGRLIGGTLLAGLAPLALGPVVLSRFDLWPAWLTIAGLAALVTGRRRLGCGVLGVAVAAKIYPGVVLPLALVYVYRQRGRREALVCAATALAAIAVCVVPFTVLAPRGVWASLSGQAKRPLQIESLGASLLLAAHQAWGRPLTVLSSHGSDNLIGPTPHLFAQLQGVLMPLAVVAIWITFARGPADRDRLLRYAAGAVCAFIALGKVLSPQYLIWLIALVPLVRGRRGLVASLLFLTSLVLTQLWFPTRYLDLAYGLAARPSWLVLARNLVLLALLATLIWPSARGRRVGLSLVATLVAGAVAATVAAAAGLAAEGTLEHSGLLEESGAPTSCAVQPPAPVAGPGMVVYGTSGYASPSASPRCVRVVVRAARHAQLFSAAYVNSLDPRDPTRSYLGDSGRCTNTVGEAGRSVAYSFRVAGRARFAVEVERCSPGGTLPPYSVQVREGRMPR